MLFSVYYERIVDYIKNEDRLQMSHIQKTGLIREPVGCSLYD